MSEKSLANQYQKHKLCGFCYHIVSLDDKLFPQEPVIFKVKKPSVGPCRGSEDEDVGRILLEMLEENIKEICK